MPLSLKSEILPVKSEIHRKGFTHSLSLCKETHLVSVTSIACALPPGSIHSSPPRDLHEVLCAVLFLIQIRKPGQKETQALSPVGQHPQAGFIRLAKWWHSAAVLASSISNKEGFL